jgi:hypothetical protein
MLNPDFITAIETSQIPIERESLIEIALEGVSIIHNITTNEEYIFYIDSNGEEVETEVKEGVYNSYKVTIEDINEFKSIVQDNITILT